MRNRWVIVSQNVEIMNTSSKYIERERGREEREIDFVVRVGGVAGWGALHIPILVRVALG